MFFKKMSFLSHYMGEVEYEPKTEERVSLTSWFINEQSYLPLLRLLIELKKAIFQDVKIQRNCRTSYNNNSCC